MARNRVKELNHRQSIKASALLEYVASRIVEAKESSASLQGRRHTPRTSRGARIQADPPDQGEGQGQLGHRVGGYRLPPGLHHALVRPTWSRQEACGPMKDYDLEKFRNILGVSSYRCSEVRY